MYPYSILFLLFVTGTANAASLSVDYKTEFGKRIVGGSFSPIEEFPYQVSLVTNGSYLCGGSIIDENHVLTAAHCVEEMHNASVRAGSSFYYSGGSEHQVIKFKCHENYFFESGDVKYNDIAILKVHPSFRFDETRAPIELPNNRKDVSIDEGRMVTVTGFGDESSGGAMSPALKVATLNITNREMCSKVYEKLGVPPFSEDCFCAEDEEHKKGTCKGDSGGPVVMNGWQIGITIYSYECAVPGFPGVYTNVAYYAEWIRKNVLI